jgi:ribosomal protein S18 acetylase RimI-like enzyme
MPVPICGQGAMLRKLDLGDMDAAALVHRTAFDHAFAWLAGLHTLQEDRAFFQRLFQTNELWGAFDDAGMIGIIAFRAAGSTNSTCFRGRSDAGSAARCCASPKAGSHVSLWTFQRNAPTRRFYERTGFVLIEETDGTRNDEKEPDALYVWVLGTADGAATA